MKLKNIPNKESLETFNFRLRKSQAEVLEQYLEFASEESGVEMTMQELLAALVSSFLEDDRDFQAWAKAGRRKAKEAAKPVVSGTLSTSSTF